MTEQERQEIENLPSAGKCEEDDFPIIGDIQTLDQYLKRYWIWENRRFFASAPNYKCKENIVEILKSEGNISDSRFEEIVDSRNYEKSPEISNPLRELEDLSEMLAGKLNSIVGEITLPSGEVVKAYDFLTCQSEECKQMLRQKDIEEYNEKSCPLTVKNRWFFAWILDKNLPFKKEQTFRGFAGRMKREGISCVEDRMLNIIIDDGLSSLVHNPKLLFTADTVIKRLEDFFPYEKNNESIVNSCLDSLVETVRYLNSEYPHVSSNNVWIFENIAMRLEECEKEIEGLSKNFDRRMERETVEERVKAMKYNIEELKNQLKPKENIEKLK